MGVQATMGAGLTASSLFASDKVSGPHVRLVGPHVIRGGVRAVDFARAFLVSYAPVAGEMAEPG